jgi:hypothetical protein
MTSDGAVGDTVDIHLWKRREVGRDYCSGTEQLGKVPRGESARS